MRDRVPSTMLVPHEKQGCTDAHTRTVGKRTWNGHILKRIYAHTRAKNRLCVVMTAVVSDSPDLMNWLDTIANILVWSRLNVLFATEASVVQITLQPTYVHTLVSARLHADIKDALVGLPGQTNWIGTSKFMRDGFLFLRRDLIFRTRANTDKSLLPILTPEATPSDLLKPNYFASLQIVSAGLNYT